MEAMDLPRYTSSASRTRSRSPFPFVARATDMDEEDHDEGHCEGDLELAVIVPPRPVPAFAPTRLMEVLVTKSHIVHKTIQYSVSREADANKFLGLIEHGNVVGISLRQASTRKWLAFNLPLSHITLESMCTLLTNEGAIFCIAVRPSGDQTIVMSNEKRTLPSFASKITACWGTSRRSSSVRGDDELVSLLSAVPLIGTTCACNYIVVVKPVPDQVPHEDEQLLTSAGGSSSSIAERSSLFGMLP